MSTRNFISYRGVLSASVALAGLVPHSPAQAQSVAPAGEGQTITVTATGYALPVNQAGQAISVVDAGEIATVQGPDLTRVLERLPGVFVAREGGVGSQTSLFVRGAESYQLLVLVDGVRVDDVTAPNGGYDLGNVLSGNIERVELLRGSNSVVWGSDAIGGVLAITTAEMNGAQASVEHGSYDSTYATAAAGIKRDSYAATITAGYDYTNGFPAITSGPRNDGFTQWQLTGKGRVDLTDALILKVNARYSDGRLDIESFGSSAEQWTRETSGRVGLEWATGGLKLAGGVALADTSRFYTSGFGPYDYLGLTERADLTGHLKLPLRFALDFGGESAWDRAVSTYDARQSDHLSSGHALLGWYGGALSVAAGVRVDDHSQFGTHVTTGANGSLALYDGWRLRGAYGEGFRAPSLYNLYDPYSGNTALKPETSQSYEAGFEKGDRTTRSHIALTFFRRDMRNLIDVDANWVYFNIADARALGMELELGRRISEHFRVSANYSYVKSRNLLTGLDLAHRPRQTVNLMVDWETPLQVLPGRALSLGADVTMTSGALDYYTNGPAPSHIAGHEVGNLRASLPVSDRFEIYGRIENVGEAHYQTVYGYNTPGRSVYLGVRARI